MAESKVGRERCRQVCWAGAGDREPGEKLSTGRVVPSGVCEVALVGEDDRDLRVLPRGGQGEDNNLGARVTDQTARCGSGGSGGSGCGFNSVRASRRSKTSRRPLRPLTMMIDA